MILDFLYPYIKFAIGTLYPAYKTWKSLRRKDETTRRRWMKYWVNFGVFQMFELVADMTLAFIFPFYNVLKLLTIGLLVLGTRLVYDSIVNRELTKREKAIDRFLNKIFKWQEEVIAIIWHAISRCMIIIITSLMAGGMSVCMIQPSSCNDNNNNLNEEHQEEDEKEDEESNGGDGDIEMKVEKINSIEENIVAKVENMDSIEERIVAKYVRRPRASSRTSSRLLKS